MKGNNKMVIKIKKKSAPLLLVEFALFMICFGGFFTDVLKLPSIIKYVNDLIVIVLLIYTFRKLFYRRRVYLTEDMKKILLSILIILGIYITSSLVERVTVSLLLWGIRNMLKGIIFFVSCIVLLNVEDVECISKKINIVFLINVLACLYEYFVLGVSGDYVGGLFGTTQGCNASLNVLIVITTAWNALRYTHRKQGILKTIFFVALCAVAAGTAELKVYILEVPIILIATGAFSKGFLKKILLAIVGIAFASICIKLIQNLIPGWDDFFTTEAMLDMLTDENGYTNKGDLNRFTALQMLNKQIFRGSTNWFGIGLGNAEYSDNFAFLNSAFYYRYKSLHYGWFTYAKIYIELGYFGILSMLYIWINCAWVGIRTALKRKGIEEIFCKMALIIALITPLLFVYNATMHMGSSCLIYLCLALGYIVTKKSL